MLGVSKLEPSPHSLYENYQIFWQRYFHVCNLKFLLSMFTNSIFSFLKDPENVLSAKESPSGQVRSNISKLLKHRSCLETVVLMSSLQVNFQVAPLTLMFVKTLAVF